MPEGSLHLEAAAESRFRPCKEVGKQCCALETHPMIRLVYIRCLSAPLETERRIAGAVRK